MPEETPNHTLAAMRAYAEQVVRGWGAPGSQEAEVLAAASVGWAGLALAHIVLHWFRQQEWEAQTSLMRPHRIEVQRELARRFAEQFGSEVILEFDTTPIRLAVDPEERPDA